MKKTDHQMIQDALDGTLNAKGFAVLQQRLREDPAFLSLYREYADLHHCLCEEFEGRTLVSKLITPRKKMLPRWLPVFAVAAACAVLALLLTKRPSATSAAELSATCQFSADAQSLINDATVTTQSKQALSPGSRISLLHGVMHVQIGDAVLAVIEAPAELLYQGPQMIELMSGQGRFRVNNPGKSFTVKTPTMSVVDLGTEFGIMNFANQATEVHVMEGKVVVQTNDQQNTTQLSAGAALRASADGWEDIPASMPRISAEMPGLITVWKDDFHHGSSVLEGRKPTQGSSPWRVTQGAATVADQRVEGSSFEAFAAIPHDATYQNLPVMLVTMETVNPRSGHFHTPGWAGLSFYNRGEELLFFGDGFGDQRSWALDIKQQLPIVIPTLAVEDARTVTLRYDRITGDVSLHHGELPLSPAFCHGKIAPGIAFDEIRLGATADASIALRSLTIRLGGAANVK